jgi:hypothetical protein
VSPKAASQMVTARRTAPPRVCECEFVVAGGQAAPLLEGIEVPFDDVAAFVILFVEDRGPASGRTASFPGFTVESTETAQSTAPRASAAASNVARISSHVPSPL